MNQNAINCHSHGLTCILMTRWYKKGTFNCHSHGLIVLGCKNFKNFSPPLFSKIVKIFFSDCYRVIKKKISLSIECVERELMHSTGVVPSASVVNFWMRLSTVDETVKFIL